MPWLRDRVKRLASAWARHNDATCSAKFNGEPIVVGKIKPALAKTVLACLWLATLYASPAVAQGSGSAIPVPSFRPAAPLPSPAAEAPAHTAAVCLAGLGGLTAGITPLPAMATEDGCGHAAPYLLSSAGGDRIAIEPAAVTNCAMARALTIWLSDAVTPAALGEPVAAVRNANDYECRARNRQPDAKLSEHALANAIDIQAFQRASGGWIAVETNWGKDTPEGRFLAAAHKAACAYFSTVIGPDGDAYHSTHFHLDLGRHGRDGTWRICQ